MGNTIDTMLCNVKSEPPESKEAVYETKEPIPMRYSVYYRGFHRPFIH